MGSVLFWLLKIIFVLFNFLVFAVGGVFLGVGVYAYLETMGLGEASFIVSNPAILLIVLGCFLVLMGIGGIIGALRNNQILLIIYIGVSAFIVVLEIAVIAYYFIAKASLAGVLTSVTDSFIVGYRDNDDLRGAIDLMQTLLVCCGSSSPLDWQLNRYFNCSAPGVEACGVPSSCCRPELRINTQCGYSVLGTDSDSTTRFSTNIQPTGCVSAMFNLIEGNQYILYGGAGFLVAQLVVIALTGFLILEVRRQNRIHAEEENETYKQDRRDARVSDW